MSRGNLKARAIAAAKTVVLRPALCLLLAAASAAGQAAGGRLESLLREGQQHFAAGDFASAARAFEQARRLAPADKNVWRGLLLSYLQGKDFANAIAVGQQAVQRWSADAQFHHLLGLAHFQSGAPAEARRHLDTAQKLAPADYAIRFDLALSCLAEKDYVSAAKQLEGAIRLRDDAALPHILLGRAYQNSNRTLQAVDEFKRALQLDPRVQLGHYHLGFAYESLGRNPEAIAEFKKELASGPPHPEVTYRLGHVLVESGQPAEAVAYLQQSLQAAAQNPEGHYELAKALLALGRPAEAIEPLKRASQLNPEEPSYAYQLARAYSLTGQNDLAREQRERFAVLKKRQTVSGGMAYRKN